MAGKLTIEEYEQLLPVASVKYGTEMIRYVVPSRMALWRVETLLTKEPETVEWISSFAAGEILVDVGANMGLYTVLATMTRRVRVFAFEPEAQNFALLNRNIQLNGLCERVVAWCAALSDESRFNRLYLNSTTIGDSCHAFGEKVDYRLRPRDFRGVQGCSSTTLDQLVESGALPPPNHIKIDVDGFEHKVIGGAERVLVRPELRSVLVEINTHLTEHMAVVGRLERFGFQYSSAQVERGIVKEGAFAGVANFVFRRPVQGPIPVPHFPTALVTSSPSVRASES